MENQERELDLLDIIKFISNAITKYILTPLSTIVKLGLRKWYVLLASVIVGVILSIVIPNYVVKRNKLEVMIRNNSSVSTAYIHEIETLSRLEPEKLSNLLELDKETLSNLVAVDMHRILVYDSLYVNTTIDYKDEFDKKKDYLMIHPNMFVLELTCKDVESLETINNSILNFINYKSPFAVENAKRISSLNKELQSYKKEILVLDSIRSKKFLSENSKNQVSVNGFTELFSSEKKDSENIKNNIIELKQKIIVIEGILENNKTALELASTIKIIPIYSKGFLYTLAIYTITCFVLTYLAIILLVYRKNIIDWIYSDNK